MSTDSWLQLKKLFHATLDLTPAERASFLGNACNDDEALRIQVEKLLASHDNTGTFLVSPAILVATESDDQQFHGNESVNLAGQRIGPYEIIREIGHGGMGTVYLAVRADDQYRKQVAIKLINRGMDTDLILRRFMMERQILANLEHPNIAHLLEGGSTADGLPYFVMEYVDGEAITSYCDAQQFNINQRLELFREVCAALQYAHQNLVVHRDIKPSNILVTEEGVPKLLDFGIAKLLSPDWAADTSEATASMVRLMTPRYASPEQLRGLSITTASDVYTLGIVLYELLSGHHPYRAASGHPEEIAEMILREEPEKPSTAASRPLDGDANETAAQHSATDNAATAKANPQSEIRNPKFLRGDLDNIVLKALRKEPERRYASVQEFAEDIRRHLEGLPVMASPDTFSYRTGKFIQRNRAASVAAAIMLITLLSATGITGWQASVARRERDKAQRRFEEVRKLANAVLFKYHDGIEKLPGSTPVREMLVRDALGYLDTLSKEAGEDLSLQRELAAAYKKVGDVQGGLTFGHTGDTGGMLDSYRKAMAIRETIAAANPSSREDRSALASIYLDIGISLDRAGDPASKLALSRKALAIYQELRAAGEAGNQLRGDLAKAYWHVANASGTLGDLRSGIENYGNAGKIYEELSVAEPSNQLHRRSAALTYKYLATLMGLNGDHAPALELYRKAVTLDQARVAADPNNAGSKLDLSFSYREVGTALFKADDLGGASENLHKALALTVAVVEADPKNAFARRALAAVYQKIGETMSKKGNLVAALENHHRATETYRALAAADPVNAEVKCYEAKSYSALGATYMILASSEKSSVRKQIEHWRAAQLWFQRSSDIWAGLSKRGQLINAFKQEPEKVADELTACEVALVRLTGARSKK